MVWDVARLECCRWEISLLMDSTRGAIDKRLLLISLCWPILGRGGARFGGVSLAVYLPDACIELVSVMSWRCMAGIPLTMPASRAHGALGGQCGAPVVSDGCGSERAD